MVKHMKMAMVNAHRRIWRRTHGIELYRTVTVCVNRAGSRHKRYARESKRLTGNKRCVDDSKPSAGAWSIISNDCCIGDCGVGGGANDGCFALQRDSFGNIHTRSPAKCPDGERDRIAVASHAMEALDILGRSIRLVNRGPAKPGQKTAQNHHHKRCCRFHVLSVYQNQLPWQVNSSVRAIYFASTGGPLSDWSQTLRELLQRNSESKRDLNRSDGLRRIPLHHGFRRNGLGDDAAGSHYRSAPNGYIRQYDYSGAECDVFLDHYALLFAIMRNNGDPYSDRRTVTNSNQVRAGRFYYRVIPYPNILPDVDAAPAVEADARSCGARCNSSEHLKNPVF